MSFVDSSNIGGNFAPVASNPFGGGGIIPGGFGAPSGFGGGESKLTGTNAPGTVSPFDQQAVGNALNLNEQAMTNRYAQLGLSATGAGGTGSTPMDPGGPAGGIGVGNIGHGMIPQDTSGTPTAEAMDLGMLPSLTGGLPGEAAATIGQIQNNNLQAAGGSGKGGAGGIGSALGPLMGLAKAGGK